LSENISGTVIRILNDREVVINRGQMSGLAEGAFIGVIDPETEDLTDPETGENLGSIRRYKVALKVTQLSERLAIAATYKTKQVNVGGLGDPNGGILGVTKTMAPRRYVTQVEKLRLSENAGKPLGPSESRVQEGDRFEVITEEIADSGFTLALL
jgi:hypothetical protein